MHDCEPYENAPHFLQLALVLAFSYVYLQSKKRDNVVTVAVAVRPFFLLLIQFQCVNQASHLVGKYEMADRKILNIGLANTITMNYIWNSSGRENI